MRKFDKTKNIFKANLLNEQRYLESKGLIKEDNQRERNELASQIIDLTNDISSAKSRGDDKMVELLSKDLNDVKGELEGLKSIKESEEIFVGKDSNGRPMYKDDEHNYYIKVNGRIIDIDPPYSSKPKPTHKLDLTTKDGSAFTPTEIKAKTPKATLVKIRHNESGNEKELWIPNFVIKNNVISSSFIEKNF
jgi:hypothetical protein